MKKTIKIDMEWLNTLIDNKDKIAKHNITISSDDLQLLITFVEVLLKENKELKDDVEYWKEQFDNVVNQDSNDFNPEIEIPQIHGEGISW